jgi:hypothetical protein
VQPTVAASQGVETDKAKGGHGAAHDLRLAFGPLRVGAQAVQHGGYLDGWRCHVIDGRLKAHYLTHEHG